MAYRHLRSGGDGMIAARVAWGLAASVALAVITALLLAVLTRPPVIGLTDAAWLLALGSYAIAGALIASRRPRNGVGWTLLAVGALVSVAGLADAYAGYAFATGAPGAVFARWLQSLLWDPAFALLLVALPLLFPTGRLPSPRWRVVAVAAGLGVATLLVVSALSPGPIGTDLPIRNPFGWDGGARALELLDTVAEGLVMAAALLALAAPIVRYRRGGPVERQQLRWFVYAMGVLVVLSAASAMSEFLPIGDGVGVVLEIAAIASVPIAISVAILRHGLYDLRVVVGRTLVYAVLSIAILLLYGGVVAVAGAVTAGGETGVLPLLVVVVVAVAFHPVRIRLQTVVDRRLLGLGRDPYAALQELGRRLTSAQAHEDALPSIVAAVREALRLPYAAIEAPGGEVRAASGVPAGAMIRIPIEHAATDMGYLVVSPPRAHAALTAAERRLLEDLGRLAAVAAHSVELTEELVRSRQALVDAREDERRRLRRDLHDGLGPELAGLALGLEAAAASFTTRPEEAREQITVAARRLHGAVDDVRRIVYDLRPPALDDLGLVQALRQRAMEFRRGDPERRRPPLTVRFDADGELGSLPAALEVAAYRIVTEAMLNVWRHTNARHCTVRLGMDGGLQVEVTDDGDGLPVSVRPGVGMNSMVERANELGGRCSIGMGPAGGTQVSASIPVGSP
jgi:signal transduction histidine kinase